MLKGLKGNSKGKEGTGGNLDGEIKTVKKEPNVNSRVEMKRSLVDLTADMI